MRCAASTADNCLDHLLTWTMREPASASSHSSCPVLVLQSGVDLTNIKMSMNPFCEIAVEVGGTAQRGGWLACMSWLAPNKWHLP